MTSFSPRHFRDALGQYPTGVTIITALDANNNPFGMTANSFASVSLEPPMVLWSVDKSAPEFNDFLASSHYAVHILQRGQQQLSQSFSDEFADKFAGLDISRGIADLPLLDEYCVRLQCEVASRHDEGDHVILVGRVLDVSAEPTEPLVFFNGEYGKLRP